MSHRKAKTTIAALGVAVLALCGTAWRIGAYCPESAYGVLVLVAAVLGAAVFVQGAVLMARGEGAPGLKAILCSALIVGTGFWAYPRLQDAAMKRDVGARAREWAISVLDQPRALVLDARAQDWEGRKVRDELVPAYLKRGLYIKATIEEPDTPGGGPYVSVYYGGGRVGASGYCLGRLSLRISTDRQDMPRRIMPGVYAFTIPPA